MGKTLAVQGTASHVGKSLLVTALCRIYARRGLRVAPFKAWNMSLYAATTPDGRELGRAQAAQAAAAGIEVRVEMNPILFKPEGPGRSQVVLLGEPVGSTDFADSAAMDRRLREVVRASLATLRDEFDLVILEGSGSPAELNLRDRDLANAFAAELADAPVVLVGDVDPGGVFGALVGTLHLLSADERARVAGLVVNKLRGDPGLFTEGARLLAEAASVPVLGVVPWLEGHGVADEDAMSLQSRRERPRARPFELEITVVDLPHLANFDDFHPLERAPGTIVRVSSAPRDLAGTDLLIIPGSKNTRADLAWLRERGLARAIVERARDGGPTLGVCAGCQILGEQIADPLGLEGAPEEIRGLGLLPLQTTYEEPKRTGHVDFRASPAFPGAPNAPGRGFYIHYGRARALDDRRVPAMALSGGEIPVTPGELDGAVAGAVVGTMAHQLFESDALRDGYLGWVRQVRGLDPGALAAPAPDPYDLVADHFAAALDLDALDRLLGL